MKNAPIIHVEEMQDGQDIIVEPVVEDGLVSRRIDNIARITNAFFSLLSDIFSCQEKRAAIRSQLNSGALVDIEEFEENTMAHINAELAFLIDWKDMYSQALGQDRHEMEQLIEEHFPDIQAFLANTKEQISRINAWLALVCGGAFSAGEGEPRVPRHRDRQSPVFFPAFPVASRNTADGEMDQAPKCFVQ